jgi:putative transposase
MHKSFKYRIYPTDDQKLFLAKQFGATRFVYNYFLANRKNEYLNGNKHTNFNSDCLLLTKLKKTDGYEWMYDINSQTLQSAIRNLEVAYEGFFKKRTKFPKFHKKSNKQTIKIPQLFKIKNKKLFIPKLKKSGIKINIHQDLPLKPICCFISKTSSGKYYVSFLCDLIITQLPKLNKNIGIDLGIKSLLITSEHEIIKNPKFYRKEEKKIKFKQKQLSKKKRGSNNQRRQRLELAKINEYVGNCRKDYLHKTTKKLIDENQVIITESLKVANMMKNHKLAKSIQDANWRELIRQLEYKAKWYGRIFYQINTFFPSSKTCNNCQFVVDTLPLQIRKWDCPNCHIHLDRDLNAAKNIRDKGLKDLSGSGIESDIKQKLDEAPRSKVGLRSKKTLKS